MGSAERWSYCTGERGRNRVRVFERSKGRNLAIEWWETDPDTGQRKRRRQSLGHRDRDAAKVKADRLAARFAEMDPDQHEPLTIGGLFDIYLTERTPEVSEGRQLVHKRVAKAMRRFLGEDREVASLNRQDWDAYCRDRASGAIDCDGRTLPANDRRPVGGRAVEEDLQVLRAACNWAVAADLLDGNPTEAYPLPEKNTPERPTMSASRYDAMRDIAGEVGWRFRIALVLCHETGHRSKSVRRLRWADVEPLSAGTVRWRGAEDKSGHEHTTALTEAAVEVLREAREERPGVGEAWVLPAPHDPSEPVSRYQLRRWWLEAEELAGLEHVDGLGWHSLRRKLADDLRDLPLKDLAAAGGWKEEQTVVRCYQTPDLERIREALEQRQRCR